MSPPAGTLSVSEAADEEALAADRKNVCSLLLSDLGLEQ
jgi:hypothetical protein